MKNKLQFSCVSVLILLLTLSCKDKNTNTLLVKNTTEFNKAVKNANPGDVITMANGIWKDAELVFEGNGTVDKPITLTVQEKGKVTLEGASNLQLAGEHLIVEGLVFKNGYTPTNAVISFRKNKKEIANNTRLTECVIDNYNNPERHVQDYWITIYGKNNRIDHNHIVGKKNLGVTMIVGLDTKASVANNHQIDHNYFGPRPTFGNNGGETLRIGTSHHALENSNTLVASNYFDRTNGEHEIISNKSCQNTFKYNTFFECTGTLTMRHGNETLVDGNVFIGNNKPSTGGVRIINEKQTVINNYHIGLTGYRFRGAFVMMNGVPNSPPNRYVPVIDSKLNNNTFVNCEHIQLCAGSDAERSQAPSTSEISENIFYNENPKDIFTIYDDISGITFKDNILGQNNTTSIKEGFENADITLVKNKQGFLIPTSDKIKNKITISPKIATKENTGTTWYSKEDKMVALNSGKTITVKPGINTLYEATKNSNPGDILVLTSGETYLLTKAAKIAHPLTIKASKKEKPIILFERMMALEIQNGGSLSLDNIKFDGASAPDYAGNAVISTSKKSMIENYKLFIDHCEFTDFVVNHSFDVLRVSKGTFADTISIQNSKFKNITGHIAALDKETDDIGAYNVEYFIMKNNTVTDVQGAALRLYRGGKDESTFGPFLEIDHNVFNNVGFGKKNKYQAAMSLYGVQVNDIQNNNFNNTNGLKMHLVVGEPIVNVVNNNYYKSGKIEVTGDEKYNIENLFNIEPTFKEGSFELTNDSALKEKGTDKKEIGIVTQN
ncbi:polysaccharide lyase 6 family protein [Lacinutrix sp. C3R15]|uniref:polysaccharide lyase 6 family protein n=1 Tax=Flavobacteriaceae TaxID=49546 RepID=UPI001C0995D3|nr:MULTISPECIES: polysaccharide lyase 6 family protein [Flavobacteriaceae]MBU2938245.1 polysaccharide lyase 6 family protein [Lacinutrix sp. C3R15]MDO6621559.1 polysaccharide lyase 6 family protein [Oceanihabitans sp. 1_MG-2023]